MKNRVRKKGFTLVELMITIGVVAILVALALPSYTVYVRKANRGDAQQLLMNWANNQEIWRASNTTYADAGNMAVPTHDNYTFSISAITTTTYTLSAVPIGDQAKDKDQGQFCNPLSLDQSNLKGPQYDKGGTITTFCWGN